MKNRFILLAIILVASITLLRAQTTTSPVQPQEGKQSQVNSTEEVLALRAAYEAEVKELSLTADKMKAEGKSSEEIARTLHGLRRELGIKYKALTPDDLLQTIYQRNIQKYGDKLGPGIDYLRQQWKSLDDIINSAIRPGGKDLNFKR